jgi:hypothetical protein
MPVKKKKGKHTRMTREIHQYRYREAGNVNGEPRREFREGRKDA